MNRIWISRWSRLLLCVLPLILAGPALAQKATKAKAKAASEIRVEKDVAVPMRDGVILRADVMRPAGDGPWPVLFFRTPYGKSAKYDDLVKAGYIVVSQDARGRYASEGKFELFCRFNTHDGADGYDSVQWCSKLPGSNGVVGTFGVSYNAFLQWRTAGQQPPALKAMAAFSIPARHTDLETFGTIRPGRRLLWWYSTMSADLRRRAGRPGTQDGKQATSAYHKELGAKFLATLPWTALPDEVFEDEKDAILFYFRNPNIDPWQLDREAASSNVPNLNVCGWYDHCNSIDLHTAIKQSGNTESARRLSRLIVGPWDHTTLGKRKTGPFDFGPDSQVNLNALQIQWFDRLLKGADNSDDKTAPVRIFVMGSNHWRDEQQWPLQSTSPQQLYLTSGGKANSPAGDGKLVNQPPAAPSADRYQYDPKNPVPSLMGAAAFPTVGDQRQLADRQDILVYQTEPLTQSKLVIGYPEVTLHAASSAPDTDFFVRLIDVAPDGEAREVTHGLVRARYRHGLDKPLLITPGQVVTYTIRLRPTANEFLPGHRIRLDVTSSDFPSYDRNHNTAADPNFDAQLVTADQTIHHGGPTASMLILPVVNP